MAPSLRELASVCETEGVCAGGTFYLIWKGSQNKLPQNRKIRTAAHFNALKTYKTAKKFFLFLVFLMGCLRLLYG